MDTNSLLKRLRRLCAESTQRQVALDLDISEQYLCDVLKGRRHPGPKLLKGLGISRKISYQTY